jgi:hypothetical protein
MVSIGLKQTWKNAIDVAIGSKADMAFCTAHVC